LALLSLLPVGLQLFMPFLLYWSQSGPDLTMTLLPLVSGNQAHHAGICGGLDGKEK
jgi:hypothetical protein